MSRTAPSIIRRSARLGPVAALTGLFSADAVQAADESLLSLDISAGVESVLIAGQALEQVMAQLPLLPKQLGEFLAGLAQYGFQPFAALGWILLCTGLAAVAEILIRRMFERFRPVQTTDRGLWWAALVEGTALTAFGLVLYLPLLVLLRADPVSLAIMVAAFPPILIIRAAEAVLRRHFTSPNGKGRQEVIGAAEIRGLYLSFLLVAGFAACIFVTTELFAQGGLDQITLLSFTFVGRACVTVALVVALFLNKQAIGALLSYWPDGSVRSEGWQRFGSKWHLLAITYIALSFLATSLLLLTGFTQANAAALYSFLVILLALALALWLEDAVRSIDPGAPPSLLQDLARRAGMPTIAGAALFGLLWIWSPIWLDVLMLDINSTIRGALLQVGMTALLTFLMWQVVNAVSQHFGAQADSATPMTETTAGSRFGTIVPLFKIMLLLGLVFVSAISILSALGVDVMPLFAGAGIVGLAIGLGSQTLVRDVVSGLFFLIDDAFRIGEYVDLGTAKGTVEKVSIRSMRLRHHLGTVHTIPYGEIKTIANMSRDWVVVRVEFRVPFDVDTEILRKKIKVLGQELSADPELGPKFLQPLKSNGVIGIEEGVMIVRCKFTARPGDQWTLRRRVYEELRVLFEREGIVVAARQVHVRATEDISADRNRSSLGAEAALDKISDG